MRSLPSVTATLAVLALTAHASAQNADAAAAQTLFDEGKSLMQSGQVAAACPKLAESQRLDPGTGTLLALALCHEKEGKLASAWVEFTEVAGRARREARKDREQMATEHAAALRKRLSTLLIEVPASTGTIPGLEIRRDSSVIGRGTWGVAVPIDFGTYTLRATAPGYTSWESKIFVKSQSDQVRAVIPALVVDPNYTEQPKEAASAPAAQQPAKSLPVRDPKTAARSHSRPWDEVEWTGAVTTAVGTVAMLASGYYLASALSHRQSSRGYCYIDDTCLPPGLEERRIAVGRGNTATALSIAGGSLIVIGVTTYILGRSRVDPEPGWSASIQSEPGGASATFIGAF